MKLREQHGVIAPTILAALKEVAKKFDLDARTIGSWSYGDGIVRVTVELFFEGGDDSLMKALKSYIKLYKLDEKKMFEPFLSALKKFQLVGYNNRARKMPFIAKCFANGKLYKFSEEAIRTIKGLEIKDLL